MTHSEHKVLYITTDNVFSPLGKSQILAYLELIAIKAPFSFLVLGIDRSNGKLTNAYHKERITIVQVKSKSGTKLSLIRLYLEYYLKLFKILRSFQPDIVHVRSYPAMFVLKLIPGRRKIVFDTRGFWLDERLEYSSSYWLKWLILFLKKLEKSLYLKADKIIMLSKKAANLLVDKFQINLKKIRIIYCAVETEKFQRTEISSGKYLLFIGSLGSWYKLDEMLCFYEVFMKFYPNADFHIVTQQIEKAEIVLKNHPSLRARVQIYSATVEEVPQIIMNSMAGVMFIAPTYSKIASFPTKLGEFMAASKKMFFNRGIGDLDKLNEEHQFGISCANFSLKEYEQMLQEFNSGLNLPLTFEPLLKELDIKTQSDRLIEIYEEILL